MIDLHASGPLEHALCGLSYDAHESGDHDKPVRYAATGQIVTCEMCKVFIAHVRDTFTDNFRVRRPGTQQR